jgi:hypothetical protein
VLQVDHGNLPFKLFYALGRIMEENDDLEDLREAKKKRLESNGESIDVVSARPSSGRGGVLSKATFSRP